MSLGYAGRLSERKNLGRLGMKERPDAPNVVASKVKQLAELMKASEKIVFFTGAGVSTACGIPDFRGPQGVWTLQKKGGELPPGIEFERAAPSLTHQAVVSLAQAGKLTFAISQNVDGLHLRSGLPRTLLAELHGNCFMEVCDACSTEYVRDFELETVGLKYTGRQCLQPGCQGKLRDSILDWEDELPEQELSQADYYASQADLMICLGTSLQITPACNIPIRTLKNKGKVVIVNLQTTPKDRRASLIVRAPVDDVMRNVMSYLNIPIAPHIRTDRILVGSRCRHRHGRNGEGACQWTLFVQSVHGRDCRIPFINSVRFTFPEQPDLPGAELQTAPFHIRRETAASSSCRVHITLSLAGCFRFKYAVVKHTVHTDDTSALEQSGQEEVSSTERAPAFSCGVKQLKPGECVQEYCIHSSYFDPCNTDRGIDGDVLELLSTCQRPCRPASTLSSVDTGKRTHTDGDFGSEAGNGTPTTKRLKTSE
eukprot:jgi/Chlat1/4189/Chrsp27S04285